MTEHQGLDEATAQRAALERQVNEAGTCAGCGRPAVWWRCRCNGAC